MREKVDVLKLFLAMIVLIRHGIQYSFPEGSDSIMYTGFIGGASTVADLTFFAIKGYFVYDSDLGKIKSRF